MVDLFYLIWLNLFVYPQDDLLRWSQTLSALEKIMKIFPDSLADKDVLHQFGTRSGAALSTRAQLMCCWHIQLINPGHNAAKETFRPDPGESGSGSSLQGKVNFESFIKQRGAGNLKCMCWQAAIFEYLALEFD